MRTAALLCAIATLAACTPPAASPGFTVLPSDGYQSFVANWDRDDQPRCAAFQSGAEWSAVMQPAAGMSQNKPFGPPEATWSKNAVLLLATVTAAPDNFNKVYEVAEVKRAADAIVVAYTFHAPAAGSYSVKAPLFVEVAKPLPAIVRFEQDGKVVCTVTVSH